MADSSAHPFDPFVHLCSPVAMPAELPVHHRGGAVQQPPRQSRRLPHQHGRPPGQHESGLHHHLHRRARHQHPLLLVLRLRLQHVVFIGNKIYFYITYNNMAHKHFPRAFHALGAYLTPKRIPLHKSHNPLPGHQQAHVLFLSKVDSSLFACTSLPLSLAFELATTLSPSPFPSLSLAT